MPQKCAISGLTLSVTRITLFSILFSFSLLCLFVFPAGFVTLVNSCLTEIELLLYPAITSGLNLFCLFDYTCIA